MNEVMRPGIDMDPVKPWNWATLPLHGNPVEIVSYPDPTTETVMVRMMPGDPTSLREVSLKAVAAFSPDRHEWYYRPKQCFGDNPTAYWFTDDLPGGLKHPDTLKSVHPQSPGAVTIEVVIL